MASEIPTLGSRGEVQITHESDESRRKIPLRIAATAALVLNAVTVFLYFIGWAGRAQVWWNEYVSAAWVSPFSAFWRRIVYVIEKTGEWGSPQMFLRLRPLAFEWIACFVLLFVFDQVPRLLYAEGLVPFAQADPANGIATALGWLFKRKKAEAQDAGQTMEAGPINIQYRKKDKPRKQWRYPQIPTPRAGREMLARWFWRIVREGGVGFSMNVGQQYKIQRDEVQEIQRVFEAEQWAEDKGGTQGYVIIGDGLDVMGTVVAEIYPTAHLPLKAA